MRAPLLETPPRPGNWSVAERWRIHRALSAVGDEWVALYRVRNQANYSRPRLDTWVKRGFEAKFEDGCVVVRKRQPIPADSVRCCCGVHKGVWMTVDEYLEAHR